MRYCPNPECPFQVKLGRPAEYQDVATTCSDCGAALGEVTAAPASITADSVAAAAAPWPAELWRRALVSVGVLAAVVVGHLVSLPGLAAGARVMIGGKPAMSLLEVGWKPFFWTMLLVETVAALVPRWRPLREDGVAGRRRLWRVGLGIGLVFAALQSAERIRSLDAGGFIPGDSITAHSVWSPPLLMLLLFGGSLLTLLAARVATEAGLGAGFALVAFGGAIADAWGFVARLLSRPGETAIVPDLISLAASVAALAWLFRRTGRRTPKDSAERPRLLPFPVAGVLPVLLASWLLSTVPATLANLVPALGRPVLDFLVRAPAAMAGAQLVIGLNAAIVIGVLCHRPSRVARAWVRWGPAPGPPADLRAAQVRARVGALLPVAVAWNVLLVGAWSLPRLVAGEVYGPPLGVALLTMAVAIALDLQAEIRARTEGDLAVAWTLIRPYEVEPALEALRAAGLRAHARGAHGRATQQFWGVLLPIHVLVPPDQVEKARAVLGGR